MSTFDGRAAGRVIAALVALAAAGTMTACSSSGTAGRQSTPTSSPPAGSSTAPSGARSSGTVASTGSGAPGTPSGVTNSEVSFVVDGTTTYGTLEVPAHRSGQRLAAALLLPGSGPTDRNGNQAGGLSPDTLGLIATILARQGIVTFRFDKYFTGRTGAGRYASDPSSATIAGDLGQADSAYTFLSKQSQVDPTRLLVVGHSEGGMFALQVATTTATPPAGLALLEPQDLRVLDNILIQFDEQVDDLVRQGGLTGAQGQANRAALKQAVIDFRAGKPVDTSTMAAPIVQAIMGTLISNSQTTYLRTWDTAEPVALAGRVKRGTRVLITSGTRDVNVPPVTIGPLVAALGRAGTTGPGLTRVQGIDHDMHLAAQPDSQAVLAPAIVTAIRGWAQPYATS